VIWCEVDSEALSSFQLEAKPRKIATGTPTKTPHDAKRAPLGNDIKLPHPYQHQH